MSAQEPGPQAPVAEMTWAQALDAAVADVPESKPAFLFSGAGWDAQLSYGRWLQCSDAVAASLLALGVLPGERVAVAAPGGPVWPVLQTACSRAGAILLPLNVRYRRDELSHVIGRAMPRVIFALTALRENRILENVKDALATLATRDPERLAEASRPLLVRFDSSAEPGEDRGSRARGDDAAMPWQQFCELGAGERVEHAEVAASDPVLLQFTSGTTAFPKGVLLSSRATSGVAFHLAERMGLTEQDVMFSTQPFYHVGGTVGTTLMPLTHRCTMVVPERYQPELARELIERHRATVRTGQAAMYAMELADPGFHPDAYRTLSRGWGAGAPALMDAIVERMGVTDIVMAYGLTEAASISAAASWRDPRELRTRCCGRALPGMSVGIGGDGGVTREAGVVGEICIRGWSLMDGYFEDPEATAAAIDAEGWLHTGDVGRLDAAGNLHFVDRLKDMIKPGGENVSAAEVERVISQIPAVARVAVVGAPDERLGQVPVAFLERLPGAALTEAEVIAHCVKEMAGFKVPRRVAFVQDWPMTESGKVQKHLLRERLGGEHGRLVGSSG
ncbi:MAG: class I adenylate-forming enzyme family protein [Solirubrobacteraceae bacterium]